MTQPEVRACEAQDRQEADLLVFGTGAAGMTAALVARAQGLRVRLFEATDLVGGTTAYSGGTIWVPLSPLAQSAGLADTEDAVVRYLDGEIGPGRDCARRTAYLAAAPEMVGWLASHSRVRFVLNAAYPDYHPDRPGAAHGGRSLSPARFDARVLGRWFARLRPPLPAHMVLGGMMVDRADIAHLLAPLDSLQSCWHVMRILLRHGRDRLTHSRGLRLCGGNALAGMLLASLRDRGVAPECGSRLMAIETAEGRVTGARVEIGGVEHVIGAARGIVLATGGTAASAEWRARLLGPAIRSVGLAPPANVGDGAAAAMAIGAAFDADHRSPYFWFPSSVRHRADGTTQVWPHLTMERARPGLIAVDSSGRRFTNEAGSYQDFTLAMIERSEAVPQRYWLVCDSRHVARYGFGFARPRVNRLARLVHEGAIVSGTTLSDLAGLIGVDPQHLARTVAKHNAAAELGEDRAFGKGANAYNRFNGDAAVVPNPCLAPIQSAPFYAVEVHAGAMSSSAGLATDIRARVLDERGVPIAGLYACGADMSSVMRGNYPGAGSTIGPAMAFAYLAALDVAALPAG